MKIHQALTLFAVTMTLQADTLTMKDGRTLVGEYLGGTARLIRFQPERGRIQEIPVDGVQTVSFGAVNANTTGQYGTGAAATDRDRYSGTTDRDRTSGTTASRDRDRYGTASTDRDRSGTTATDRDRYGGDTARTGNASRSTELQVPAGTVVTVRMIDAVNSDQNNAGETFRASLDEPIVVNGNALAPAGGDALVRIARVDQGGRISGSEEIAIELAELTINGRRYPVQSNYAEVASKSRGRESAKVIGGTAVVGAIIGAIAGGGKGAAIGAASGAGAGAAIQTIRGQRVQIPSESRLDFTLGQPMNLR